MTAYLAIGTFVLAVVIVSRVWPGKTEHDLVFEADESALYECRHLTIWRYPRLGRCVIWPGSKIQITTHRVIFSQKGLWSTRYVIREIAVRNQHTPQRWRHRIGWGQVPMYHLGEDDFSLTNHTPEIRVVFTNGRAPNLQRMEIGGVASIEQFMQAVTSTHLPACREPS